jgi:hypothetical protein
VRWCDDLQRKIDVEKMKRVQAIEEDVVEIEANVQAIEQKKQKDKKSKAENIKAWED